MGRIRARALALTLALGAGLVAPGILWASDEVPGATTETTSTTATTPPAEAPATTPAEPPAEPPPTTTEAPPPPPATTAAAPAPPPTASASKVTARAAASDGVTIQGFAFHPASLTVNVGDTVTWTNRDSAAHTATADNGSFDTGNLAKGESGSHTFNQAGTFSYLCTIHPNMKGTITVVGSSSGSGSTSGSSGSGSGSASNSSSPSGSSLPSTGLQLGAVALLGLALLGAGGLLRRVSRRLTSDDQ